MAEVKEKLTGADAKHGYRFGVDGLMTVADACNTLSVTRWTIDRLCQQGRLRKGKVTPKHVGICRRSVTNLLKTLEV